MRPTTTEPPSQDLLTLTPLGFGVSVDSGRARKLLSGVLSATARHHGQAGRCGTCMDARGIPQDVLIGPAIRSTMDELTDWTLAAEKVLVF